MGRRAWRTLLAGAVLAFGTVAALATRASDLRADEYVTWPVRCPNSFGPWGIDFDGISFHVFLRKHDPLSTSSVAAYDVVGEPTSDDGRWWLVGGGVSVSCFRYGIPGVIEFEIYRKLDDWGTLVPVSDDDCGGGGGGGVPPLDEVKAFSPGGVSVDHPVTAALCSGGGGGGGGSGCTWEYGVIEISYDGGVTWEVWWQGWYTVCDEE